jgi:hypothetical protein
MTATSIRLPALYISHGGGPCFFMEPAFRPKDLWDQMAAYLRNLGHRTYADKLGSFSLSGFQFG